MAKGKKKDSVKGTTQKVKSGDMDGPISREALKYVPEGPELYRASISPNIVEIPIESKPKASGFITGKKFRMMISALRGQSKITNDKGEEIDFEGKTKADFIDGCNAVYPAIKTTVETMYAMGSLLHDVRSKLRPKGLYHTWLNYVGIPRRTAQNYLQAYQSFRERLPQLTYLGIRKLLIASRLPNSAEYVASNEHEIARETVDNFENKVRELLRAAKKGTGKGKGRKPTYVEVAGCKIRASRDGKKIFIEVPTKSEQKKLIDALKALLSQTHE